MLIQAEKTTLTTMSLNEIIHTTEPYLSTWATEYSHLWTEDEALMDLLATDIRLCGQKEPITINKNNSQIIDGCRRVCAMIYNVNTYPLHVSEFNPEFVLVRQP